MMAKLALFTVALVLLGATVTLAAPPASDILDDSGEQAMSAASLPLYISTSVWPDTITFEEDGNPVRDF